MTSALSKYPTGDPHESRRKDDAVLFNIFIFLIPMLKFIEVKMGGRLFLSEILLFVVFLLLLSENKVQLHFKMARTLIILGFLWLYGQVLTDVIRETHWVDYSRGWAKIIFTIINFSTLFLLLYNRERAIVFFSMGLVAGGILEYFLNPGTYAAGHPWKFGVGAPLSLAMVLIASAIPPNRYFSCSAVLLFTALFNIYMGFRSMAGILFLTAVYMLVLWKKRRKNPGRENLSIKNMASFLAVLGGASFLLITGYGYAAGKGLLGENAMQLYQLQSYGKFGLLIGGRSEILVSGRAIMDAPIIGHGSWAKNEKYTNALIELKRMLGYHAVESDEFDVIPTHSHLFGAWVEAGLAGALFWMWILGLPVRCIVGLFQRNTHLAPLYAFICFQLIWDIFFSPYGGNHRLTTPYHIVTLFTLWAKPPCAGHGHPVSSK